MSGSTLLIGRGNPKTMLVDTPQRKNNTHTLGLILGASSPVYYAHQIQFYHYSQYSLFPALLMGGGGEGGGEGEIPRQYIREALF